jgi:ubiquinone/menaquinone biosynthesis C-methylase UbiE
MLSAPTEREAETPSQQASPALIFETLNRYQHTMALKGAIDLELFTHIARGATTPPAIAASCQADERGVRILCDFLTVIGFLHKTDGRYKLTSASSLFLVKESPTYMGSVSSFLAGQAQIDIFRDVAALVRKGGALDANGFMTPENSRWVDFANSMVPMIIVAAQKGAAIVAEPGRKIKVLDIAAGHGMFGISVARLNPAAEIVAVDWKNVLSVAAQNAARAGIQNRFRTIPGDVFEVDLGDGYDLVLIPNFLHHFDPTTNIRLLRKVRAAMNSGGRVATTEFVPDDDRISPPIPASFSLMVLGATERGDTYTFREFDQMFRAAGFGDSQMKALEPTSQALILTAR